MIFLSFDILKKNIKSMYIWYLIGLPSSSIMLSIKSMNCFQRRLSFLFTLSWLLVLVLFRSKVDAIKQWPQPIYIKDVQVFLGLANYYQQFVKGFA